MLKQSIKAKGTINYTVMKVKQLRKNMKLFKLQSLTKPKRKIGHSWAHFLVKWGNPNPGRPNLYIGEAPTRMVGKSKNQVKNIAKDGKQN